MGSKFNRMIIFIYIILAIIITALVYLTIALTKLKKQSKNNIIEYNSEIIFKGENNKDLVIKRSGDSIITAERINNEIKKESTI